jgi:hypothetical protein
MIFFACAVTIKFEKILAKNKIILITGKSYFFGIIALISNASLAFNKTGRTSVF